MQLNLFVNWWWYYMSTTRGDMCEDKHIENISRQKLPVISYFLHSIMSDTPNINTISLAALPPDIIRMIIPQGGQWRHMRVVGLHLLLLPNLIISDFAKLEHSNTRTPFTEKTNFIFEIFFTAVRSLSGCGNSNENIREWYRLLQPRALGQKGIEWVTQGTKCKLCIYTFIPHGAKLQLFEIKLTSQRIFLEWGDKFFESAFLNVPAHAINIVFLLFAVPTYLFAKFTKLYAVIRALDRLENIFPGQNARRNRAKLKNLFESCSSIAELKIVGISIIEFDIFRQCLGSVRIDRIEVSLYCDIYFPMILDKKLRNKFAWVFTIIFRFFNTWNSFFFL